MKNSSFSRWVRVGFWLGAACFLLVSSDCLAAVGGGGAGGGGGGGGGRRGPDPNKQPNIANPFFGEVMTASPTTITVKGDRKDAPAANDPNASTGKLNIHFSIGKDVNITRDGQKIAATDIKRGEKALVGFTMKDESYGKRRVTEIKVGNVSAGEGAAEKAEAGGKGKGKEKGKAKGKAGGEKE